MKEPAQISNPEYSVARIIARMKEAAARQGQMPNAASTDIVMSGALSPRRRETGYLSVLDLQPIQLQPRFDPDSNSSYHVNDLLKFHDKIFIQNAYRAILKRGPDAVGFRSFLDGLRAGRLNKIDVLARLRYSAEGRSKQVEIEGLRVPAMIRKAYRVPYAGYLLNLLIAIGRLPNFIRSQQQFEAHILAQQDIIVDKINHISRTLLGHADEVSSSLRTANDNARNALEQLEQTRLQVHEQIANLQNLDSEINATKGRLDEAGERLEETLAQLAKTYDRVRRLERQFEADLNGRFSKITADIAKQHEALAATLFARSDELKSQLDLRMDEERTVRVEGIETIASIVNEAVDAWQKAREEWEKRHNQMQFVLKLKEGQLQQADANQMEQLAAQREQLAGHHQQLDLVQKQIQTEIKRVFDKQQQVSTELVLQGERLTSVLTEARKRLPDFDETQLKALAAEADHTLDAFYASFDEQFRGSRQEIKDRLRIFLSRVIENNIGSDAMPVLDVGCGRGEWLELLRDEGLVARGVDSNRILVEACQARGLEVTQDELVHHLQQLPDASLGAVTGFHIIEHLPIETLVEFLNQAVRVLKPAGAVIFETPNPQNVLVGSCNFYFDPTHRNPLPSQVTRFLIESRGFTNVEVLNLNPSDDTPIEEDSELARRFNTYFYGPMDYAVIGFRSES